MERRPLDGAEQPDRRPDRAADRRTRSRRAPRRQHEREPVQDHGRRGPAATGPQGARRGAVHLPHRRLHHGRGRRPDGAGAALVRPGRPPGRGRRRRGAAQPDPRRLPHRRDVRHGHDHRRGAGARRAGAVGPVPLDRRGARRPHRGRCGPGGGLHLQVPQRRPRLPRLPLGRAPAPGHCPAADHRLDGPRGAVRDGARLRRRRGHRQLRVGHPAGARPVGARGSARGVRRGQRARAEDAGRSS